jgi:non-ribosomal peptide synthetase component F/acyl carrier protein
MTLTPEGFERFLSEDRAVPFDTTMPPLLLLTLVRTGAHHTDLVLTAHHVLFDGWSEPILLRELLCLYASDGSALAPARSFRDFLAWLSRGDPGASARAHVAALDGLAAPTLLASAPTAGAAVGFSDLDLALTADEAHALARGAAALGSTLNSLVQAAWAIVLADLTGGTDVVFGTTVSGRPPALPGVDAIVGLFINTVPVRVRCAPWQTLAGVVADLQAAQAALLEHHDCGLADIHAATGFSVLFDTLVVFQSYPFDSIGIAEASAAVGLPVPTFRSIGGSHYPLVVMAEQDPYLRLRLQYRHSAFDGAAAARIADRFRRVLLAFLGDRDRKVGAIEVFTSHERTAQAEEAQGATVATLFGRRAVADPAAVALVVDEVPTNWRELHERADRIAGDCLRHGVGPETVVAVSCSDPLDRVVAVLAVGLAGGCVLPIDPRDPWLWSEAVVDDAGPQAVIVDQVAAGLPWRDLPTIRVEPDGTETDPGAGGRVRPALPGHVAYLDYAPDRAAKPLGTAVTHGGLAAGVPRFSSTSDDPMVVGPETRATEILLALCAGRTVEVRKGTPPVDGTPTARTGLRLLSPSLAPAAPGAVGELYVAGDFGRGHPGRSGLTAHWFVADPYGVPGSRMVRTGVRGRGAVDGRIEHVGRFHADTEREAVETVLLTHPMVVRAVVVAADQGYVGYVVSTAPGVVTVDELRAFTTRHLPDRLALAAVVELGRLPTSAGGRIDHKRLPEVASERREARNEREALLCRLAADVLEVEPLGIDDDFFALGGNSLLATRLIGRIRNEVGMEISIRSIFQYPTVAQLAVRWDDIATTSGPRLRRISRA